MSRTITGKVQKVTIKGLLACVWIGDSIDAAQVCFVMFPDGGDPRQQAAAAAIATALVTALSTQQPVDVTYGDSDTMISNVAVRYGGTTIGPIDDRYRLRNDFTIDDAHNDDRYRRKLDFTIDDPHNDVRYRPRNDFTIDDPHNDVRYRSRNDFTLDDPHNDGRYRPLSTFTVDDAHNDSRYRPVSDYAPDDLHNDTRYLRTSASGRRLSTEDVILRVSTSPKSQLDLADLANLQTLIGAGADTATLTARDVRLHVSAGLFADSSSTAALLRAFPTALGNPTPGPLHWPLNVWDPQNNREYRNASGSDVTELRITVSASLTV
jgi:hypothetical protein